jgi:hypothetical protein
MLNWLPLSGRDGVQEHIWDSLANWSRSGVVPETPCYLSVIMGCRLLSTKSIYRNLFVHPEMEEWVERQKPQTQVKFRKVSVVVLSDTNFWKNLDMFSRIFEPVWQA